MKVKEWGCDKCGAVVMVTDDYEPQRCCSGRECGCMGMVTNPVFCDKCLKKIAYKPLAKETNVEETK